MHDEPGDPDAGPATGRLFRSLRADGDSARAAVPALALDEAMGLRSISLAGGDDDLPPAPARGGPDPRVEHGTAPDLAPMALAASGTMSPTPAPVAAPQPAPAEVVTTPGAAERRRAAHAATGPGGWAVLGAEVIVTVAAGFVEALALGQVGWLTGAVLVIVALIGAMLVRRADAALAVIAPPLAFVIALLTAGQLTVGPGDLLITQGLLLLQGLGSSAPWIFGATGLALIVVLIRRR